MDSQSRNEVQEAHQFYRVVRFYQDDRRRVIYNGLTLAEAQAHCQRSDTRGADWFDGYEKEVHGA